jgi:hypothetical protein
MSYFNLRRPMKNTLTKNGLIKADRVTNFHCQQESFRNKNLVLCNQNDIEFLRDYVDFTKVKL